MDSDIYVNEQACVSAAYMALGLQRGACATILEQSSASKYVLIDGMALYSRHADEMFTNGIALLEAQKIGTHFTMPPGFWVDDVAAAFGSWYGAAFSTGETPRYEQCVVQLAALNIAFFKRGGTAHNDLVDHLISDYPEVSELYEWAD